MWLGQSFLLDFWSKRRVKDFQQFPGNFVITMAAFADMWNRTFVLPTNPNVTYHFILVELCSEAPILPKRPKCFLDIIDISNQNLGTKLMGGTKGQLFLAYYKNIVLVREAIHDFWSSRRVEKSSVSLYSGIKNYYLCDRWWQPESPSWLWTSLDVASSSSSQPSSCASPWRDSGCSSTWRRTNAPTTTLCIQK